MITGVVVGLLGGLLLFGPAGYLARAATGDSAPQPKPPAATTGASGKLSAFENNQVALNKWMFNADLEPMARSWLPYISGCSKSGDKDGPKLGDGESLRVSCHYGGVTVFFVQFQSLVEREKARGRRMPQNLDAKRLLPGAAEPGSRKSVSGSVEGNYVEYGFKGDNGHTYAATWWDDTDTAVAAFLIADWNEGLNESWEPMRDLWRRYS
ncbi:MAG TPA: hypothetical protein VGP31_07180 [Planosporangium sp.]|nr:hypothetical protein [Planosporangium sp.]